jgi:hypothetical protein
MSPYAYGDIEGKDCVTVRIYRAISRDIWDTRRTCGQHEASEAEVADTRFFFNFQWKKQERRSPAHV